MSEFLSRNRHWLAWVVPVVVLLLVIGFESDWGRNMFPAADVPRPPSPRAVNTALAPEFQLPGGLEAYHETIERPLLAPTRRTAPVAPPADAPRPVIVRGQYVLLGTTVMKDKSYALLKENASGKQRRVAKGETLNRDGLRVANITNNRVVLQQNDDTEEISITYVASPKVAAAPPVPVQPAPGVPPGVQPPAPAAPQPAAPAAAPPTRDAQAQATVEERRRAARARAAGQAAAPAAGQQGDGAQPPPATDWNTVFQRMMGGK
jgi:hypothetical protein